MFELTVLSRCKSCICAILMLDGFIHTGKTPIDAAVVDNCLCLLWTIHNNLGHGLKYKMDSIRHLYSWTWKKPIYSAFIWVYSAKPRTSPIQGSGSLCCPLNAFWKTHYVSTLPGCEFTWKVCEVAAWESTHIVGLIKGSWTRQWVNLWCSLQNAYKGNAYYSNTFCKLYCGWPPKWWVHLEGV